MAGVTSLHPRVMARVLAASLLALLALVAAVLAGQHDECQAKLADFTKKCKAELKLTDDDLLPLAKNISLTAGTKCLIKCIAENFGVYKDNKVDEAAVIAMVNKFSKDNPTRRDKEIALLNQCKGLTGTNDCDTAAKIYTCVLEGAKKLGLGMD